MPKFLNQRTGTQMNTQPSAWFALYTRHQHERTVAQFIQAKQMEVFLPVYKTVHRWKDRVKELSLPLFPNYVFVFTGFERRADILSTPGVYDFVRVGGVPAPLPIREIEAVRKVVEHGLRAEPHPFLRVGDRVTIRSGPLGGVEGILVRKKSFYRLIISVELLARSISVEVEAADVRRVAGRSAGIPLLPHQPNMNLGT